MPFQHAAETVRREYAVSPLSSHLIPSLRKPEAQILWVGCSDSWITETGVLDVLPEETFVHRNLGNVLSNGDLSSRSAIDYALEILKVKHIVICGHYDCSLIKASKEPDAVHSWYRDLSTLHKANEAYLNEADKGMDAEERSCRLVEVYVLAEGEWLKKLPSVAKAMKERGLQVHTFVFDKQKNASVTLKLSPEGGVEKGGAKM